MELRYHACGCPIRIWDACLRPDNEPTFFDGRTCWTERTIRHCPRCGGHLTRAVLRTTPPAPAGTLATYLLTWPYVQQQLEEIVRQRAQRDPAFRAGQAQAEILELEAALNRVADLAAGLEEPTHALRKAA